MPAASVLGGEAGVGRASSTSWAGSSSAASTSPPAPSGIATAAFEEAIRYAQEREAFGKPIAQHQADPAQARADGDEDRGGPAADARGGASGRTPASAPTSRPGMAKLFATETAEEVALEAMRIHGGYGYSQEYVVERLYRDAPRADPRRGLERDPAADDRPAPARALRRLMDFSLPPELDEIRAAVRELCAGFPGEYWRGARARPLPGGVRRRADRAAAGWPR